MVYPVYVLSFMIQNSTYQMQKKKGVTNCLQRLLSKNQECYKEPLLHNIFLQTVHYSSKVTHDGQ